MPESICLWLDCCFQQPVIGENLARAAAVAARNTVVADCTRFEGAIMACAGFAGPFMRQSDRLFHRLALKETSVRNNALLLGQFVACSRTTLTSRLIIVRGALGQTRKLGCI